MTRNRRLADRSPGGAETATVRVDELATPLLRDSTTRPVFMNIKITPYLTRIIELLDIYIQHGSLIVSSWCVRPEFGDPSITYQGVDGARLRAVLCIADIL